MQTSQLKIHPLQTSLKVQEHAQSLGQGWDLKVSRDRRGKATKVKANLKTIAGMTKIYIQYQKGKCSCSNAGGD